MDARLSKILNLIKQTYEEDESDDEEWDDSVSLACAGLSRNCVIILPFDILKGVGNNSGVKVIPRSTWNQLKLENKLSTFQCNFRN